ncbi:MAG: tetratricopeptide repeat protein, partial [Ferruginibacter sp.]
MKSFLFTLLCFSFLVIAHSQIVHENKIDNFKKNEADTNRVKYLCKLANDYKFTKPDTCLLLANQSLLLSKQCKFEAGESDALKLLGNANFVMGNYPLALEYYFQRLKIEEKKHNPLNYAVSLDNIGTTYLYFADYKNALAYLYKADSVANFYNLTERQFSLKINLGETYYRLQQYDSAHAYFYKAMVIANQHNNTSFKSEAMVGIANVLAKQGNIKLAKENYSLALSYMSNNDDLLYETNIGLATTFEKLNKNDSAHFYALHTYLAAQKNHFISKQLDAAIFLSNLFIKIKNTDSAFFYLQQTVLLKDKMKGEEKIRETQIMSSKEQLRQIQLQEKKEKDEAVRKQQLQLILIGIFIPFFLLITLFISRRKVHVHLIKFLGVISLLLFFEYITLLFHPFVEKITHHTPIYEILIFVTVASFLIPVHHKLEHWLIEKLIIKQQPLFNKKYKIKTVSYT